MKLRKFGRVKRFRRSKEAVHSLIGDFLVLAITVLLLSGIFMYVLNLPPPDDTTYTDFKYTPPVALNERYDNSTHTIQCDRFINLTNSGGQDLYDHSTGIYLFVNDSLISTGELHIHDSENPISTVWRLGDQWSYTLLDVDKNASIRTLIVDKSTNTIVYDKFITGIPNASPVIGSRGTTPAVGVITELATFYVYIVDSNNDLQSTYIDMTSISDRLAGDDYIELIQVSGALFENLRASPSPPVGEGA